MKILFHDYGGHAFTAPLTRELARLGHEVHHAFSASVLTPQGMLAHRRGDPSNLTYHPIKLAESIDKYSFLRRAQQEAQHGEKLLELVRAIKPDVVISSCTPAPIQAKLVRHCRAHGIKIVTWVQDLYGVAAHSILKRRLGLLGRLIGRYYIHLDRVTFRESDALILITRCFERHVRGRGVRPDKIHVIPNWAAIHELPVLPKDNAWSRRHGLHDKFCFMYSGTLAMKHNPQLLLDLAHRFSDQPEVRIVVVSQGRSVDWLREHAAKQRLNNLVLLPLQPFDQVPYALATADVQLLILDPEAGAFSVPSKVLTYMCSARPTLLALSSENLAARTVTGAGAGLVVGPTDGVGLFAAASTLVRSAALRKAMGDNARHYAEQYFDPPSITASFNSVLDSLGLRTAIKPMGVEAPFSPYLGSTRPDRRKTDPENEKRPSAVDWSIA